MLNFGMKIALIGTEDTKKGSETHDIRHKLIAALLLAFPVAPVLPYWRRSQSALGAEPTIGPPVRAFGATTRGRTAARL